jgi:hypothetical protein
MPKYLDLAPPSHGNQSGADAVICLAGADPFLGDRLGGDS